MLIWWAWWGYDFLNSSANIPMRWCKWRSLERSERRGSKILWKNQSWAAASWCNEGGLRPPIFYKRFQWETKGGSGEKLDSLCNYFKYTLRLPTRHAKPLIFIRNRWWFQSGHRKLTQTENASRNVGTRQKMGARKGPGPWPKCWPNARDTRNHWCSLKSVGDSKADA